MVSKELTAQKCVPCDGGMPTLPMQEAKQYLEEVPGWMLSKTDKGVNMIVRDLKFKDFKSALGFVNVVGNIAESENHHPNIYLHSWNRLKLELYTHVIGGLSKNDFIMAAKINEKLPKMQKRS